jgi:hypothetical protein
LHCVRRRRPPPAAARHSLNCTPCVASCMQVLLPISSSGWPSSAAPIGSFGKPPFLRSCMARFAAPAWPPTAAPPPAGGPAEFGAFVSAVLDCVSWGVRDQR